MSGSAAGHDIGKFGCRPGERVPYLHYYYTDLWFRRRRLTDIGHIAANHSVWDLEPDYLSVESLLLIYADFRVKQTRGAHDEEVTHISSLSEAFDVILAKLDRVDEEKRERYRRVYMRLRDFERFLIARGVDVSLKGNHTPPQREKNASLMTDEEAFEVLRLVCVEHNIELMSRLTGPRSFAQLLKQARSETDWRRLRAYLGVIESYSLYLRIPQKVQALAFLYELLMHREGDIRRQAAALLGEIIVERTNDLMAQYPTVDKIEEAFRTVVDYAQKNRRAIMHVYNSVSRDTFESSVMKLCAYMTEQYLKSAYPDVCISPEDREVLHRFIKCQLFGLCIDWMLGGMKQDVGEQMARVLELYRGVAELILENSRASGKKA